MMEGQGWIDFVFDFDQCVQNYWVVCVQIDFVGIGMWVVVVVGILVVDFECMGVFCVVFGGEVFVFFDFGIFGEGKFGYGCFCWFRWFVL